jgi:hypothetical protein
LYSEVAERDVNKDDGDDNKEDEDVGDNDAEVDVTAAVFVVVDDVDVERFFKR